MSKADDRIRAGKSLFNILGGLFGGGAKKADDVPTVTVKAPKITVKRAPNGDILGGSPAGPVRVGPRILGQRPGPASRTTRVSRPGTSGLPRMGADDVAAALKKAKTPRTLGQKIKLGAKLGGLSVLGGAGYVGFQAMRGGRPAALPVDYDMPGHLTEMPEPTTQTQLWEQYFNENPYVAPSRTDYTAMVNDALAQEQASLDAYLAQTGAYGRNQASAIAELYGASAKDLLASADEAFTRGQMTAADIDAMYAQLAAQNLGLSYGEGLSTPASITGGLVAPSGEAATAADTTRTYGLGLADYLGREAGLESAAIQRMAQSQALQGAGLSANMLNYIAMADAQQRREMAARFTEAQLQAARAQAEEDRYLAESANAWNAQKAQALFSAQLEDTARAEAMEQERLDYGRQAYAIWSTATKDLKKDLETRYGTGQDGMNRFIEAVMDNPYILMQLTGGA